MMVLGRELKQRRRHRCRKGLLKSESTLFSNFIALHPCRSICQIIVNYYVVQFKGLYLSFLKSRKSLSCALVLQKREISTIDDGKEMYKQA